MRVYRMRRELCWLSIVVFGLAVSVASAQDAAPKIAFISDRDGVKNVFVMEADGSSPVNLTDGEKDESGLTWSPDGQTIAFSRAIDDEGATEIFTVGLDGTPPVQLTDDKLNAGRIVWSPDGSQLVFAAGDFSTAHLFIMNADGTDKHMLIEGEADTDSGSAPSWSPDGS